MATITPTITPIGGVVTTPQNGANFIPINSPVAPGTHLISTSSSSTNSAVRVRVGEVVEVIFGEALEADFQAEHPPCI